MTSFIEAVDGEVQRAAGYRNRAVDIMEAFQTLDNFELHTTHDGEEFWLTPEVTPRNYRIGDRVLGKKYSLASRADEEDFNPAGDIFLIVNKNFESPSILINRHGNGLTYLGGEMGDIEEADAYMPLILDGFNDKIRDLESEEQRQKQASKYNRHKWYKRFIGLGIVAGLGFGGWTAVDHFMDGRAKKKADREASRDAFDALSIDLTAEGIAATEGDFVASDTSYQLYGIPNAKGGDSLVHPRLMKMSDALCKTITTIEPAAQVIRIQTNAASERLFAAVDSTGEVQVCYFGQAEDPEEENPTLAVQVTPRSEGK